MGSNPHLIVDPKGISAKVGCSQSRKQRQKEEQSQVRKPVQPQEPEPVEIDEVPNEPEVEVDLDTEAFEAIDFDDLRGAW